jgi:phosphatidylinositol glycan class B
MFLPAMPEYKKWFLWGLVVQLVAAWFSVGYNHYDEHFQVLEFCNYKLGLSPASALPWEFATQCRSALQPFIAYCFCKALDAFGLYNPFHVAFLLRLMMGILTWLVTCKVVKLMLPQFASDKGQRVYVWCSFLLWFVAYCGVRFSAENVAGLLFFLALSIMQQLPAQAAGKQNTSLIAIGLLLGFVFAFRIQMSFAFIGLGLWLLLHGKWPLKNWLIAGFAGLFAVGLSVIVDYWFYGAWVFTPFNYFNVNILHHAAARFGVYPWWYYFTLFINYGVPPVSIVMLPLFFIGIWKHPRHLFSWICIAFIAGHSLIGHKEMRFLLPMSIPFIFLSCQGLEWLLEKYPGKKVFRWAIPTIGIMNLLILTVKILIPSHESVAYYKFIYDYAQKQPMTLICIDESPYYLVELNSNFYKPKNINVAVIHTQEEIAPVLNNAKGQAVIFLNPTMDPVPMIANYKKERLYCLLPDWVRLFNFNDWQSRSFIWTIYKLNP